MNQGGPGIQIPKRGSENFILRFRGPPPLLPNMGMYNYVIYQKGNPIHLLALVLLSANAAQSAHVQDTSQMCLDVPVPKQIPGDCESESSWPLTQSWCGWDGVG